MIGIKDQCFGVEIELTGITRAEAAEALAAYATHPKHVAVADSKVRPYTANRACMDFEV